MYHSCNFVFSGSHSVVPHPPTLPYFASASIYSETVTETEIQDTMSSDIESNMDTDSDTSSGRYSYCYCCHNLCSYALICCRFRQ